MSNEQDRESVKEDMYEDLAELAPHRIAGLGVTVEELGQFLSPSKV